MNQTLDTALTPDPSTPRSRQPVGGRPPGYVAAGHRMHAQARTATNGGESRLMATFSATWARWRSGDPQDPLAAYIMPSTRRRRPGAR